MKKKRKRFSFDFLLSPPFFYYVERSRNKCRQYHGSAQRFFICKAYSQRKRKVSTMAAAVMADESEKAVRSGRDKEAIAVDCGRCQLQPCESSS